MNVKLVTVLIDIQQLPHAEGLPLPGYATEGAAGMDLVAALQNSLIIKAGKRALVPTGLKIALSPGYEMQIRPRSGLAFHHGITIPNSPGTIDQDYRGEIGVILLNMGEKPFTVERGMRIAQAVISPVIKADWQVKQYLDDTTRKNGGFGSTGLS